MTTQSLIDRKQELIDKIIKDPLHFTEEEFLELVTIGKYSLHNKKEIELNFNDLRKMIIRIFDINEATLKDESDATQGLLGYLNKRSTSIRQKRFYKLIDDEFRNIKDIHNSNKKLIVAEGDSWFQFPVFIKDIVDWLSDEPDYAVYSIAYGGDWFTNILFDEKYVEELSIHAPDVFLISAGGNDFVGSSRLAVMVDAKGACEQCMRGPLYKSCYEQESDTLKAALADGYKYVLPVFYSFIWTIKAQYWKLFDNLLHAGDKYTNMRIITQGYDYVLPTLDVRIKKWYYLQPLVNKFVGSGHWLKRPLLIKGITDENTSNNIMKALIYEINMMFIDLVEKRDTNNEYYFKNVYHIDCRETAKGPDDWWDEIHLHSEGFKKIAEAYRYCINSDAPPKSIKVKALNV